jgi:hypothetical protein
LVFKEYVPIITAYLITASRIEDDFRGIRIWFTWSNSCLELKVFHFATEGMFVNELICRDESGFSEVFAIFV